MLIMIPIGIATALAYGAYVRYMLNVRKTCQCVYCAPRNTQDTP